MKVFNRSVIGFSCLIFLGMFLMTVSCTSAEERKEKHYQRGMKYASDGQYKEAVIEFNNVIQLDPDDADAKHQLGSVYLKMGGVAKLGQAFQLLSEAVEKDSDLIDAHLKLAKLFLLSNELEKATEKSDLILKKEANHVDAHLIQARIHLKEERLDEAEKAYRHVLKRDAKRLAAYYELSGIRLRKKDAKGAEALLRNALAVDVESIESHLALARSSIKQQIKRRRPSPFLRRRSPYHRRTNYSVFPWPIFIGVAIRCRRPRQP